MERKYDVTLTIFEDKGTTYEHCKNLVNLNLPGSDSVIKRIPTFIKRVKALRQLKKQNKYKACISFMNTANFVNVLSGGNNNITSIRTVLSSSNRSLFSRKASQFILSRSKMVVSLSNYVKLDLVKNFHLPEKKVLTIYNPCLCDAISKTEGKRTGSETTLKIVTAGRCVKEKGQWHLIKAFSKLLNEGLDVRLIILGEGYLKEKQQKLSEFLGITEKVNFYGFVPNPYEIIKCCDIFVLPSVVEGFGNALVEAMACGIPVVSANCAGGPAEILKPNGDETGYGILTKAFPEESSWDFETFTEEENSLFVILKELCENPEKRRTLGQMALKRSKDFDISTISNKWIKLIEDSYVQI